MRTVVVFALLCGLCAAGVAHAAPPKIFLNGVNIDGVKNQKFDGATVVIDADGNVLITVKGYEVQTVSPAGPATPPVEAGPVTKRYFIVSESSAPGMAQYDIDVFINSVWVKRISSNDPQAYLEISRHLKKGKNILHFAATKQGADARKSSSAAHFLKVYVGEGNVGGNNIMLENVLIEYKRDATEVQNFADDFVLTGK